MAWAFTASWGSGYSLGTTDSTDIQADIQTAGGNRDSGHYGIPNTAWLALVPGDLPGTSYTVTAASWSGGTVTLTLSASHGIAVGQHFSLSSVNPSAYDATDAIATSGSSGTTLKFALGSNPGTWVSGGTVLVDALSTPANGCLAINASGVLQQYVTGTGWVTPGSGGTLASLTVTGASKLEGALQTPYSSVSLSTGLNSNITLPASSFARVSGPTGAFSVGGFTGGADGMVFTLFNPTLEQLTIVHLDSSSSSGNKIYCPTQANIVLGAGGSENSSATFQYDGTSSQWIPINYHPGQAVCGSVAAQATNSASQSISTATATAVTLDTTTYDVTGNVHSTVTNTSRMTVPSGAGGTYLIEVSLQYANNATGSRTINIEKNGSNIVQQNIPACTDGLATDLAISTVLQLSAGDYIEMYAYHQSGTTLAITEQRVSITRLF